MCDLDHGFCSTCCKSGYKLRKWCRPGKKAKKSCNPSFCVARKVTEKIWVCGRCLNARQRKEAKEILEKKQRMERMDKMDKVRKAMESRTASVEEVGKATDTRNGAREVRKGLEIRKAMDITRLVNDEGHESRAGSDHYGGGDRMVND